MAQAKNTLDKDLMFQKIMPSSQKAEKTPEAQPAKEGLRARVFSKSGEVQAAKSGIRIINLTERAVLLHLDEIITKFHACRCDRCRSDALAIALNELPPCYAVSDSEEHIKELADKISEKKVLAALVHAVIQVRSYPRH